MSTFSESTIGIVGCDSEHWGVQCSKSCGHCANETACNVRTGQCEQGCTEGFISPPMCNDGMKMHVLSTMSILYSCS